MKHQLLAIFHNLLSWLLVLLRVRKTKLTLDDVPSAAAAVQILSPGGYERFELTSLDEETSDGVLAVCANPLMSLSTIPTARWLVSHPCALAPTRLVPHAVPSPKLSRPTDRRL